MAKTDKDDPAKYPALGRWMTWVDKPGSDRKMFWALVAACVVVFLLDFTYKKYGHFGVEYIQGFYAVYGFVMFTGLIFAATALRMIIKRPENYYGDKAVDTEEYPEAELDKVDHDA